ncbi:MAG: hypothetical protein AAF432_00365 [Planctomycetota bacterium]
MGRHAKLTPEVQEIIVKAVRAGMYVRRACDLAGIGRTTMHRWTEQGQADEEAGRDSMYRDFRNAVREAEAQLQQQLLTTAMEQITGYDTEEERVADGPDGVTTTTTKRKIRDHRSVFELLRRRFPREFEPAQQHEITGGGGKPIDVGISVRDFQDDPEALEALRKIAERQSDLTEPSVDTTSNGHHNGNGRAS